MKIRPLRTLILRTRLKEEGIRNKFARKIVSINNRYATNIAPAKPHFSSSLSLVVHPYPGLGHQVSAWISGNLWAQDLGLNFASPFISSDKNGLLQLATEKSCSPLAATKTVRLRAVPDERDPRALRILASQVSAAQRNYPGRPLTFRLSLDQARYNQIPAQSRLRSALIFGSKGGEFTFKEQSDPYIAIHIRRGDVHENHVSGAEMIDRWVAEAWHVKMIATLRAIPITSRMPIRVYGLGIPGDFPLLAASGATLFLNGDRDTDLIDLAAARVLVLSPSSFSFTAALASRGVVVGRVPWWHHVPNDGRWVHTDAQARVDAGRLNDAFTFCG